MGSKPGEKVTKHLRPAWRRLARPTPDLVNLPDLAIVPGQGFCRQRGVATVTRDQLADDEFYRWWLGFTSRYPRCGAVPVTAEEAAIDVLEKTTLPAPRPYIAPGRAITGLRAFLEPRSPTTFADRRPTALGLLELEATGVYHVDWGDATTGPHPGPGGPWPDGNITHTYEKKGTYDVEVTILWTVRWRLGPERGTLTVPTEGRIEDFPVEQVQAVRNR